MSDTSQGPGWWLASDGMWYPPELWTGARGAGPSPPGTPSGSYRTFPDTPHYGSPGGAYGQDVYGAARAQKTNGLAVASLICSCAGLFFLPIIPGIVMGFVARSQIRHSNGAQRGDGLAIAGIIVGFGWAVLLALAIVLSASTSNSSGVVGPVLAA